MPRAESASGLDGDQRKLVAIVFTDIVGSTSHLYKLGTGGWAPLLTVHFRQIRRLASRHGGKVVDKTGDGTLATFPRATDGVLFARAAMTDPGDDSIGLRACVHWGYVTEDANAKLVTGRAIHFAARIMGLVAGVGLCVSDNAKVQIKTESPDLVSETEWTPLDNCELKGIPGLHRVWLA